MSAFSLRPYQDRAIREVRAAMREVKRVLLTAPTGSGKGVIISYMIGRAAEKGHRCWLICHRRELLDQLSASLWSMDVPHGVIAAGRTMTKDQVQIASVQTLARRMGQLTPPDLLCYDEAHHSVSPSSLRILNQCPTSWIIGLTATPERLDGRGLGDVFERLVVGPTVAELTQAGYLSPYRMIGPPAPMDLSAVHTRHGDYVTGELEQVVDKAKIVGDAVAHYKKYVAPHSCLVFCVSRKHAHHVEEAYQAEGVNAKYVGGDTPTAERKHAVAEFKAGRLPVLTSVEIFSEGVDSPGLRAVQLLRPTQSLGLWMQQVGRGLRIEPGKKECIILDHVGSCWRHGLPDDDREWTLEGTRSRKKPGEETGPSIRVCERCFAVYRVSLPVCPVCGAAPPVSERRQGPEVVDGELVEIQAEEHRRMRRREEGMAAASGLDALVELAIERGYKASWAGIRHALRSGMDKGKAIAEARRIWFEKSKETA